MQHTVDQEMHAQLERAQRDIPIVVTDAQLVGLPEVVQRYLRSTGIVGKETIRTVHLTQRGSMRIKPDGKWLPMVAAQSYTTDPPAFLWRGTIRMFPFVPISGMDLLNNGHAQFRIALLGRIPLVNEHGPEVLQADMLRYLSEVVWFPTAWLSDQVTWEGLDATAARVTLHYHGVTASATCHFNAAGEFTQVSAERYMKEGKRTVLRPWIGRVGAYREWHGLRIPTTAEVAWQLPSGEFSYFRCEITAIAYNASPSSW